MHLTGYGGLRLLPRWGMNRRQAPQDPAMTISRVDLSSRPTKFAVERGMAAAPKIPGSRYRMTPRPLTRRGDGLDLETDRQGNPEYEIRRVFSQAGA